MKIAVVGAGALGSVYGARLSRVAEVTFVVRSLDRAPRHIRLEHAMSGDRLELDAPRAATTVPAGTDVVLVAVRVDQLDDALFGKLADECARDSLVVVLAPLLPHAWERAHAKLGDRLVAAMPGVIAYQPEPGRVRYWTPRPSPTQIEDRGERTHALVAALREAHVPAETSSRVRATNAAVTIAFFPMLTGIAAGGGSIDRMLADDAVMKLGFAASKETLPIAKSFGALPAWGAFFFNFVGPFTARAGIKLGRARVPEAFTFLEQHFGHKLAEQNKAIFHEIELLAAERGVKIDNLRKLVARSG